MSYRQLAEEMGLSETSIKRLFSQESFSLKRVEAVCKILELDMFDLALMAKKRQDQNEVKLTIEQENELAADPKLMTLFYFLLIEYCTENLVLVNNDNSVSAKSIRLDYF